MPSTDATSADCKNVDVFLGVGRLITAPYSMQTVLSMEKYTTHDKSAARTSFGNWHRFWQVQPQEVPEHVVVANLALLDLLKTCPKNFSYVGG
jgi:hypothetical protein